MSIQQENDIRDIKGIAAILESMAAGGNGVRYTGEALDMMAGKLIEIVKRCEESGV